MTDRLYFGTESGLVMAVREEGAEFPTFYRRPELQPMAPGQAPKDQPTTDTPAADDNAPPDADPTLENEDDPAMNAEEEPTDAEEEN